MSTLDDDFERGQLEMEEGITEEPTAPPEAAFKHPLYAEQYILAGKAMFTIRSKKTGTRYTYKVTKAAPNPSFPGSDTWFVALLDGPDNTSDYTYLGILRDGTFRLTAKSRYPLSTPSVKAFAWTWDKIIKGKQPPDLEIWHSGHCGRCGRLLTVPESIERGIGPDCAEMM